MSKKAVIRALDRARANDLPGALEEIRGLDAGFLARRFRHYELQPDHRQAAIQLRSAWEGQRPTSKKPRAEQVSAPFEAPLAPSDAEVPEEQVTFDKPLGFLSWVSADWSRIGSLDLGKLSHLDVWALGALACLSFPERERRPPFDVGAAAGVSMFARAVGLESLLLGASRHLPQDTQRTVPLTRVRDRSEVEPTAERMASLLTGEVESDAVRLAVKYVLVELLRNVVQHSGDPLGAVAAAQRMGPAQRRSTPMIQLVVADAGIGIPTHLKRTHPGLRDYRQALEKALLPHISGTFEEGLTGSFENAGLGLYMISELARETRGRLLIATHGAALVLAPTGAGRSAPRFLEPAGVGFPGTLVAFELPSGSIADYHALMQRILRKAEERTPARAADRWLQFAAAGAEATRVAVASATEDTARAATLATEAIQPALLARKAVELDFAGLELCTQSWLHALLFEPVRVAWALRVPIHVVNAVPAVEEGLRYLEAYALGG